MNPRYSTMFAVSMIACGSSAPITSSTTQQPSGPVAATHYAAAPASAARIEHAAPATVDPSGAAPDAKLAGTVLVWADATFFTGPDARSPSMQLATLSGPRRDHIGEAVPMRVVATKGELIEVEASNPEGLNNETDCAWFDLKSSSDVGPLRLFVRRDDLAPVLGAPYSKTFDDGTSLKLYPGTPVVPLADGRYQVLLAPLAIPATVPAGSVGHAYEKALDRVADAPLAWSLDAKATVTVGDETLTLSGWSSLTASVKQQGAITLFPLDGRCGQAVVAAPSASVAEYRPGKDVTTSGGIGLLVGGGERWYLPPNTVLATPDGRVITHSRGMITVDKPTAKQVCIERSLYISTNLLDAPKRNEPATPATLRLCAPARLVKHDKGFLPGTLGPNDPFGGGNVPTSGVIRAN